MWGDIIGAVTLIIGVGALFGSALLWLLLITGEIDAAKSVVAWLRERR